jgi:MFS family permease
VAPRATFGDVFAVGEFRALWSSEVLSVAGDRLALVALTLLVYDRTRSPLLSAAVYAVGYLPYVIGGLFLADLADRHPRRSVMVACDLARAALVAVMVVPHLPLWALVTLLFAVTMFTPVFEAARSAVTPEICKASATFSAPRCCRRHLCLPRSSARPPGEWRSPSSAFGPRWSSTL